MMYYIITFFLLLLFYWYFILNDQRVIQIPIPIEKMTNISVFDGNDL